MTAYKFFVLMFFAIYFSAPLPVIAQEIICKRRKRRELQKVKKTYERMKKLEKAAEFAAIAEAYRKDK
jgi:hypothetical protein